MEDYTNLVIKPKDRLFEVNLKEIWQYRDLFSMFVKRDIVTQYKQTILGRVVFYPAVVHHGDVCWCLAE